MAQRLEPGSFGHYYNRNRWYRPDLGRFTTKDVNATALPIMAALTVNAESFNILLSNFSGTALYGDGMNLYLFAGANPVNFGDPSGLIYDPFADVDDVIFGIYAERTEAAGHAMKFFEVLAETAIRAALEGMIVAMVPGGVFIGHSGQPPS